MALTILGPKCCIDHMKSRHDKIVSLHHWMPVNIIDFIINVSQYIQSIFIVIILIYSWFISQCRHRWSDIKRWKSKLKLKTPFSQRPSNWLQPKKGKVKVLDFLRDFVVIRASSWEGRRTHPLPVAPDFGGCHVQPPGHCPEQQRCHSPLGMRVDAGSVKKSRRFINSDHVDDNLTFLKYFFK